MDTFAKRLDWAMKQRGMGQSPLARAVGVTQPTVHAWVHRGSVPDDDKREAVASALSVEVEWLFRGKGEVSALAPSTPQLFTPLPAPQPSELTQTIPVYGSAQGGNGDGWFELNGHAIDHVRCPPGLVGVKGAYSLRVQGISMEPRYFEGEIVYVNPARSVTPGCFVVIQLKPTHDGDSVKAFIKQLVRRTAEKLVVHQYQPDMDYDIPAETVLAVHRIMNGEELF